LPPLAGYIGNLMYCSLLLIVGLFIFKKADDKFIYYV